MVGPAGAGAAPSGAGSLVSLGGSFWARAGAGQRYRGSARAAAPPLPTGDCPCRARRRGPRRRWSRRRSRFRPQRRARPDRRVGPCTGGGRRGSIRERRYTVRRAARSRRKYRRRSRRRPQRPAKRAAFSWPTLRVGRPRHRRPRATASPDRHMPGHRPFQNPSPARDHALFHSRGAWAKGQLFFQAVRGSTTQPRPIDNRFWHRIRAWSGEWALSCSR